MAGVAAESFRVDRDRVRVPREPGLMPGTRAFRFSELAQMTPIDGTGLAVGGTDN